jgi:predicted nucleic acid-binding protein
MELVAGSACSAFDCECVALAHRLGVQLVTADRALLAEFPNVAIALADFAGDPGAEAQTDR